MWNHIIEYPNLSISWSILIVLAVRSTIQPKMCLYTVFMCAQGHILAILCQIRDIKVCMESGEHVTYVWANCVTQTHKLVWMHMEFLHAPANMFIVSGIMEIRQQKMEKNPTIWWVKSEKSYSLMILIIGLQKRSKTNKK